MAGLLEISPEAIGLLSAGAGILQANRPSLNPGAGGLGAIGAGITSGLGAYQAAQEAALRKKAQERAAELQAEQLKHLKMQMEQEALLNPLRVKEMNTKIAQADLQQKLPAMIMAELGKFGQAPAPVMYQDTIKPEQVGDRSGKMPSAEGKTRESYFQDAMKILDPVEKQAALEAGFRQWPEYRPQMNKKEQEDFSNARARSIGTLGAMIEASGLKGGDALLKLAPMFNPFELSEGKTYITASGATKTIPKLDVGMVADKSGAITMTPGVEEFLRKRAIASVDPLQASKFTYETGQTVPGVGGAPVVGQGTMTSPTGLPPAGAAAVKQKEAESIAAKSGDILESSKSAASGAASAVNSINQIRAALPNIVIGPFADKRLMLTQIADVMNITGATQQEKLANTRAVINGFANMALDAAGKLKGSGSITDAERALLNKASSGSINELSMPELKTVLDVAERQAFRLHQSHNELIGKAKGQGINTWAYESSKLPPAFLPKDAKASDLIKGRVYATPKGDLVWNGLQFEDQK
jgi:hypothetical protein